MKLSDNQQAREQVDALLKNWGRWCRDNFNHLGYGEQPMFKDYRAPRQEKTRTPQSVDVDDAWLAQDTMTAVHDSGHVDEFWLLAAWYPHNMRPAKIADIFGVSRRAVYYRRDAAMQVFFDQMQRRRDG